MFISKDVIMRSREHVTAMIGMYLICCFCMTHAAVWYVHPDSALNSIQAGLDSCVAYDTVLVGTGIYYENVEWPYLQGINLISEHGPDSTIIDGQKISTVIYVSLMPQDSVTLVHGFTVRNGVAHSGGGIYSVGGKPTISGNVITGNTSHWLSRQSDAPPPRGGGIYTEWASPMITDNVISDNIAEQGGGIASLCDAANIAPRIFNNTISSNSAHIGGGLFIDCPFTTMTIRDNMISQNTADYGGGVACYYAFQPLLTIVKNMVIGNTADSAGGGIWCYLSSRPFIDSCVISENVGDGIYCGYYASPVIRYNNIIDNAGYGVRNVDQSLVVLAENNWWGDATGPYNPITNPGGLGDTVSHYVDYDPWLTSPGIHELVPLRAAGVSLQVYPNPFYQDLQIRFTIHDSRFMMEKPQLGVYDATGQQVKSFVLSATDYLLPTAIFWKGIDDAGRRLPCGVYFLQFRVGDCTETVKVVLLR